MIITLDNLNVGIEYRRQNWPNDALNNKEYYDIYTVREQGITDAWWRRTVERLSAWRANRGCTNELIHNRGIQRLGRISQLYQQLITAGEPCITNLQWSDIEPLFVMVSEIKQTRSSVFASKMCHFLFPKLFIVFDNKATGAGHYELFWRGLKGAWSEFEQQEKARNILFNAIRNGQCVQVHPNYPVETVIMETYLIGYNHRENNH